MFYRKWKIKNIVVLDVRSAAHLEAFLIKQGMVFLHVSIVSGMRRGVDMRLHASYAEAWQIVDKPLNTLWTGERNAIVKRGKNGTI